MLGFKRRSLSFVVAGPSPAWRAIGLVARPSGPRLFLAL
jgi:hypothetical protein